MIRIADEPYQDDVVPHAIFWRPLIYFSNFIWTGFDQLDRFNAISYKHGNRPDFDLRAYDGHPAFTTSLYLPVFIENVADIMENIAEIIDEMNVPKSAVAWQRSESQTNELNHRTGRDRLREREARILALKIASLTPDHTASTSHIKDKVPEYIKLTSSDLKLSATRPQEQLWQQIVGNVISHQHTPEGPFEKGYATRTQTGLSVTDKGMDYLKSIGFCR